MEFHHLRYFVSVARHLSFTRAAEENHVAQPSLSQQIRRLEQELGSPLFDRSAGGKVRLTDAGQALLPRAEAILKQAADARSAVDEVVGRRAGRLVVGTLSMTGSRVLPGAVAEFRARYPGIVVELREEPTAVLIELVIAGEIEVALTTLPVMDPGLERLPILSEDILLAVPRGHRLAYECRVELAEVADEPFMLMKQGAGFRELCLSACRSAGFEPKVAYESSHIDTLQSLVAVGLGVTLVPRMAAEREMKPSPIFLEVSHPRLTRTLALVWRKDRYLSSAARGFLEMAQSYWG